MLQRGEIALSLVLAVGLAVILPQASNAASSLQATNQRRQQGAKNKTGPISIGRSFENQYLKMTILPGWADAKSVDQKLSFARGNYLLTIDPIFGHASGIVGGRFGEIVQGMPSIAAVMVHVEGPAGGWECAQWPPEEITITKEISLTTLYTDSSKPDVGCSFPSSGQPVWFGSYFSGITADPENREYSITLTYGIGDVNRLPRKGSSELEAIFAEAATMLKTLQLKPPIVISRIDPQAAPPGANVTIYGSGFDSSGATVRFSDFPGEPIADPKIAADGKSLTFQVPASIDAVSCHTDPRVGRERCAPIVVNGVDVNNCPDANYWPVTSCGIAIPPATYQLSVTTNWVSSNRVSLSITAPESSAVFISLIYPNHFVSTGDIVTVLGSGFTSSRNTVQIGSATVYNVPSSDGKTITFQAPAPAGRSLLRGLYLSELSVFNANGVSNSIRFAYCTGKCR